ncbi:MULTISPECIES: hypothetical protein [unclassified Streptomyces]|uniref:hypothetical protein n=1 Tax=unclassified Streptomyces TaxID=2593676 RepID=UPI0029B51AA3|nr:MULTISPECIES: hypothetical protein [unclassified Streptomyces]MDX3771201.1 hypothetical protein [Streptomyces sp. AK08-01B]MDX3820759.1 hypothetical protein [Streptomyces sp. AK08-01A]
MRGESCTGKTRAAFEAIRVCLKDWQLVFPKNARRLLALLDANALAPRTVLWLNEAQIFLTGTDAEEATAALHSRLEQTGPVVILGTLWPEYHRTLTATPEPGKDTHPNARALLNQVKPVDVPASFTTTALRTSLVHCDRSLATAVSTSTGGRITQTLAAGPQLVDHYQQATSHSPYGHAVITTAMVARRLGHTSPLPAALLKAAAPGYLSEQQRAAADPDTWFAHALDYAREKVKGVVAALEPVANPDGMGALPDIYRLSDYLDHHARTTRRYAFPPDSFWPRPGTTQPAQQTWRPWQKRPIGEATTASRQTCTGGPPTPEARAPWWSWPGGAGGPGISTARNHLPSGPPTPETRGPWWNWRGGAGRLGISTARNESPSRPPVPEISTPW